MNIVASVLRNKLWELHDPQLKHVVQVVFNLFYTLIYEILNTVVYLLIFHRNYALNCMNKGVLPPNYNDAIKNDGELHLKLALSFVFPSTNLFAILFTNKDWNNVFITSIHPDEHGHPIMVSFTNSSCFKEYNLVVLVSKFLPDCITISRNMAQLYHLV